MERIETFEVEILTKESLKDYLTGKKHSQLVSAILNFVKDHFNVVQSTLILKRD